MIFNRKKVKRIEVLGSVLSHEALSYEEALKKIANDLKKENVFVDYYVSNKNVMSIKKGTIK